MVGGSFIVLVDLATGDTIKVGNTGLNKLTNAIAFDENYDLFGIIGAENEVADFISIIAL